MAMYDERTGITYCFGGWDEEIPSYSTSVVYPTSGCYYGNGYGKLIWSAMNVQNITVTTYYEWNYEEDDEDQYCDELYVLSGGVATNITVDEDAWLFVEDGGTVVNLSLGQPWGDVYAGGKLTGWITFWYVDDILEGWRPWLHIEEGAIIDFDLTYTWAGASALINCLAGFSGGSGWAYNTGDYNGTYTLTVAGNQANGTYRLAEYASGFSKTITVVDKNSGSHLGTLNVGDTVTANGKTYTLSLSGSSLSVTVGTAVADTTPPQISLISGSPTTTTTGSVSISASFTDNVAVAATYYRLGENGTWGIYSNSVTVSENTTVYFKAVDRSGNESQVYSYIVSNISGNTSSGSNTSSGGTIFDSYGNNHSFASAYYLGSNTSIRTAAGASIEYSGEEDYYSFTLTQSATVTLTTSGDSGGDTVLYLYDAGQYQLDYNDDTGGSYYSRVSRTLGPGTYYAKVRAFGDGTIGNYSLSATVQLIGGNTSSGGNPSVVSGAVVGWGDYETVSSGVTYVNVTVTDDAQLTISRGGVVSSALITDGAQATVYGSVFGAVLSDSLNDGGGNLSDMYVSSGGYVQNVRVDQHGNLCIFSGGTANSTTVNGGYQEVWGHRWGLNVYSGGVASNTFVDSNGELFVEEGGKLTGRTTLRNANYLSIDYGAIIDFDLTRTSPGEAALLDDLSRIQSTPLYTLTVNGNQSNGTYRLADGASGFSGAISVVNTSGSALGTLYVGRAASINGTSYSLNLSGGSLSVTVSEIDLIAPQISSISGSPTTTTTGSVTVTATFTDNVGVASTYYMLGEYGDWWSYSGSVTVTDNTIISFKAVDAAGNESNVYSYVVNNIVKPKPNAPTATANITTVTGQPVTVFAEFSWDSAVGQYSFDGWNWSTYTRGVTLTQNGTVYFRGLDAAGNVSDVTSYTVNCIDNVPPARPTASANITAVTNQTVTVFAEFSWDSVTGQYSFDGWNWNEYTGGITLSQNGTVYFRGFDAAGNVSDVTSYTVNCIDNVPPDAPTAAANIMSVTSQPVTVFAEFSWDSAVGQYSFDGWNWRTYTGGITFTQNGTVYFRGLDAIGNISDIISYTVNNIDSDPPAAPTVSANITSLTSQPVTVFAEFSWDSTAGQYSFDGWNWSSYTAGITLSQNGAVYFRGLDAAGNASAVTSYTVNNIDSDPPAAPTVTATGTELTSQPVTVFAEFSWDSTAGQYSFDGQYWMNYTGGITFERNGTVYFRGLDLAGNVSDVTSYTVNCIDNVLPDAPTALANITAVTNQPVTVFAEFSRDSTIGQYSLDASNWNTYTGGITFTQNGTVWFRGLDAAGNISAVTSYTVNCIDNVLPDAPTAAANIMSVTDQPVTVFAEFSWDSTDGQYSLDGVTWNPYTGGITFERNGTVWFRGLDAAGNVSEITEFRVANIGGSGKEFSSFVGDFIGNGKALLAVKDENAIRIYRNRGVVLGELALDDGWDIAGIGDFNGDGADDILRVNGEGYVVGEMSDGYGDFSPQVLNFLGEGWSILGIGDFNGNGSDDVLIANPTGASSTVGLLGYWESGSAWILINGCSAEWECVATGDFNGDGKSDMLWRNSFVGDGGLTYNAYCAWIVDPPAGQSDWRMVSVSNPSEWDFLCAGDFDGNGTHDIAMVNGEGVVGIWGIADGYLNSWSVLSAVDPSSWGLAGVGDFNGDGTDDIAWRNTETGLTGYWQINGKSMTAWQNLATIA